MSTDSWIQLGLLVVAIIALFVGQKVFRHYRKQKVHTQKQTVFGGNGNQAGRDIKTK